MSGQMVAALVLALGMVVTAGVVALDEFFAVKRERAQSDDGVQR